MKKASLESAIPIPRAGAQRRLRFSVFVTHQACDSAGGTVLCASRPSRMISVQSSTQLSQMYTPPRLAISRSTCFCSLPQKEQWYSMEPVVAVPIAFSPQRIALLPMPCDSTAMDSTAMTYLCRPRVAAQSHLGMRGENRIPIRSLSITCSHAPTGSLSTTFR